MAKMADEGLFCTQYLLSENCARGADCLYQHIRRSEVSLRESLPNGEDSVKGTLCVYGANNTKPNNNNNNNFSHQKCLTYSGSKKCNPAISHPSFKKWDMKLRAKMDCQHPSTSDDYSASTATARSHFDDMDDCLGAAAVLSQDARIKRGGGHPLMESLIDGQLNINAPEFVPRTRFNSTSNSEKRLCPFAERDGFCKYPTGECTYLHGDLCDLCTKPALHPYNEDLRKKHTQDCIKRHERDMEHAFAVARSKEKICGICFEVIMQKNTDEQRFGILPSCNHCFCLSCIRRWRQSKQFENKIIRSCPECRISSDFVCPSAYWVDTQEDKNKVIEKYKSALAKKDCKYFRFGRGHCPFGNKCFYRHCLQNGKKIDVGPPPSTNNVSATDPLIMSQSVEIIQVFMPRSAPSSLYRSRPSNRITASGEIFTLYCIFCGVPVHFAIEDAHERALATLHCACIPLR